MTDIHTTWTENRATWDKGAQGVLAQILPLMNDLYANEWSLYQNHFCPNMKLLKKKRINSKYYKKYDPPRTPYDRIL